MKKLICWMTLLLLCAACACAETAPGLYLELQTWHPGVPGYDAEYMIIADNGEYVVRRDNVEYTCDQEGVRVEKNMVYVSEACRNRGVDVVVTGVHTKTGEKATVTIPVKSWNPTFADEFDGTAMDESKWRGFETGLGDEVQVKGGLDTCTVADGYMSMNLTYNEEEGRWVYPAISTYGLFVQRFGCFSAKLKIPPYGGLNSAFWFMSPGAYRGRPLYYLKSSPNMACHEIDFLEISAAWTKYYDQYHKRMGSGIMYTNMDLGVSSGKGLDASPEICPYEEYAEYSCAWLEDALYFYCNGQLMGVETGLSPDDGAMKTSGGYMILTLATANNDFMVQWMGPWEYTKEDSPITLSVDWVRAYE